MEKYSFLTSIYKNTDADEMRIAIDSMMGQTYPPDQIVIVFDGEISEPVRAYVDTLTSSHPNIFTIVPLEENVGLGRALAAGMKECRNELVARADTDDVNVTDRIEKELKVLESTNVDMVGSNISEFVDNTDNVVSHRNVPITHNEICEYLKFRCPFNHMTVLFKKSKVLEAGGYQHWHFNEDMYLWVRMYLAGAKFANVDEALVFARIDTSTFKRRGGYKYYKSERDLFKFMYKNKVIGWFAYQKAKFVRFIVQVLMPNWMRQWVFKRFARK